MFSSAALMTLKCMKVTCLNIVYIISTIDFSSADLLVTLTMSVLFC